MSRQKTVNITDQEDVWIKAQIEKDDSGNDSELNHDLNRREQARRDELETIRTALIFGENGEISQRTPQDIKRAVLADMVANSRLPAN